MQIGLDQDKAKNREMIQSNQLKLEKYRDAIEEVKM
jgi:hypothetical protein